MLRFSHRWITILVVLVGVVVLGVALRIILGEGGTDSASTPAGQPASNQPPSVSSPLTEPINSSTTTTIDWRQLLDSETRSVEQNCEESVRVAPPGVDFPVLVEQAETGTCFRFAPGNYRFGDVIPKDMMTFLGDDAQTVVLDGRGFENAFHGTASDVTIARMTLVGFDDDGGEKKQEQAPIRGTSALWKSDRGEMATDWLIEEVISVNNLVGGVFVGDHFTVRNSRFSGNGVTGIGGDDFVGGLIEGNIIDSNGRDGAGGVLVNSGGIKFTQAGSPDSPVVVRDNEVFANSSIGIWCDIGCDGFEVIGNYIYDHFSQAVMVELSQNALIEGNWILRSNEWTDFTRDWNAGSVTVGESRFVTVRGNYIQEAESGVVLRQTVRPARPEENFLDSYSRAVFELSDVIVIGNTFEDIGNVGLSVGSSPIGESQLATLSFSENAYLGAPTQYWWNDAVMSIDSWRAAGQDIVPGTALAVPTPPAVMQYQLAGTGTPLFERSSWPDDPEFPLRINTGGEGFTDQDGLKWLSDRYFVGGEVASHNVVDDMAGDSRLYQVERWGTMGYQLPVGNGRFRVVLHHSEVFEECQQKGCRVFDVEVEGVVVRNGLDIYSEVGGYTAYELIVETEVSDGVLDIEFGSIVQNPQVSGIEVIPLE